MLVYVSLLTEGFLKTLPLSLSLSLSLSLATPLNCLMEGCIPKGKVTFGLVPNSVLVP